ncbi:MAG: peptidoglycan DD-metalloendopeptidase family protein [Gemmiger sp.]|uniref:peptidoglycan DD-metalloendopeptidase family protein n=2 Tax=Gemmiger TaxID=204475 RepID=UPI002E77F56A|nr:peptidoglycan DD-metalloendopeptidase family protein [Gemmiger sp.]MEE0707623.1 peptidoglycan DD-metalloendopeptidase family protein [Gemmiger sp.]
MNSTQTDKQPQKKKKNTLSQRLDDWRCKRTVRAWHRKKKRATRRRRMTGIFSKIPYSYVIGDLLYMIGFWVEYAGVCAWRKLRVVVNAIAATVGNLLLMIVRPFVLGILTLVEDLTSPFTRMASGIRHIQQLSQEMEEEDAGQIRAAKLQYFRRGVKKYYPIVWNAITYILPVIAAAALVIIVRNGLDLHFVLNVQVNGESVGYVDNEQVFENARDDVQSRINTAKSMLIESGASVPDTQWDVSPTYTLAVSGQTMTESEIANAILRTASDEIVDATAVYIDGELRFVTTEGDHLRTYLESVKEPYEDTDDPSVYTAFAHEIRLLDGVYLNESISSYSDIINELNQGAGIKTYTAVEGDTVQSIIDTTGVSFDSLAQMNPELLTLDQEVEAGTEIITGAASAELLKVKVVRQETETVAIPFDTQNSESSEYDFGKVVTLQEGEDGSEDVTYEITMIDGVVTDRQAISYNVTKQAVPEITVTGTRLKSGMVAQIGSGSFIWPVPNYTYVSRWMSSGHRGADICAAYGTTIIASDSGTVIAAGWHYSYGNYVEIDHGNGYKTLYAHMSAISVTQGQAVSQGDKIGEVGSTGNSTGNHCHFEMFYNGALFSAQTLFPNM